MREVMDREKSEGVRLFQNNFKGLFTPDADKLIERLFSKHQSF